MRCGTRRQGLRAHGRACGEGIHALETNRAGVFAIGDVRSGSVKRVAAAVGEGAQVVAAIHTYLAQIGGGETVAPPLQASDGQGADSGSRYRCAGMHPSSKQGIPG